MYIVEIKNGDITQKIQDAKHKLLSGSVVQGINSIDSFSFSMLPNNPGFDNLHEFTTFVKVFNTAKNRTEFNGRVLYSTPSMSESGLIVEEATCESFLGFLCDSQQSYREEARWQVDTFVATVIKAHNDQVEDYKKFEVVVDSTFARKSFRCGIQRENTWKTLQEKLIKNVGGEIKFDVIDGKNRIYIKEIHGHISTTEIALSKNMKSITKEKDPSALITRLIPLGATIKDDEGNDTGERVDITSVNNGKNYIDDENGLSKYGIHIGYAEFDDVTEPSNVLLRGKTWLQNNNKVYTKYIVTALDLSLIGLDFEDFQPYNYYPIKNKLLRIDDNARIIKKTIDVCNDTKGSFEIGENFESLSEMQRHQASSLNDVKIKVSQIITGYVTKKELQKYVEDILKNSDFITEDEVDSKLEDYPTEDEVKDLINDAINNGDSGGDGGDDPDPPSGGDDPDTPSGGEAPENPDLSEGDDKFMDDTDPDRNDSFSEDNTSGDYKTHYIDCGYLMEYKEVSVDEMVNMTLGWVQGQSQGTFPIWIDTPRRAIQKIRIAFEVPCAIFTQTDNGIKNDISDYIIEIDNITSNNYGSRVNITCNDSSYNNAIIRSITITTTPI